MLTKWLKKTKNTRDETVEDTVHSTQEKKHNFKSADMVFGFGVLLIVGGLVYMVRSVLVPGAPSVASHALHQNKPEGNSTENIPPYKRYLAKGNPWEKSNKNKITPQKNVNTPHKPSMEHKDKKANVQIQRSIQESTAHHFVCTVMPTFSDYENKELVYYKVVHKSNKKEYIPAYKDVAWDEKGIRIRHQFMVSNVDIAQHMVEVEKDKWIPALSFAKCVLVEEHL